MSGSAYKFAKMHQRRPELFLLFLPLFLVFLLPFWAISPATALADGPRLNQMVEVEGPVVRLKDLFENAGPVGQIAVFRSPDPGTTGKISVARILAAAKKQGLKHIVAPAFAMVTISRASRVIPVEELEELVRAYLLKSKPEITGNGKLVITLPEGLKDLHLDPSVRGELSLSSLDWSQRSGRFTARFSIAGGQPVTIRGSARMMVEVTVARAAIARGKILSSMDVETRLVSSGRRGSGHNNRPEELVGLSARRSIQAGQPISMKDLEPPRIIRKNQLVTIMLEVPGLVLRTEGKALADASLGQAVKILNTRSKRIINATARGPGLVTVSLSAPVRSGS